VVKKATNKEFVFFVVGFKLVSKGMAKSEPSSRMLDERQTK